MMTALTMRRIAPKQRTDARFLLEYVAEMLERGETVEHIRLFLAVGSERSDNAEMRVAFQQLGQIMAVDDDIDEFTPFLDDDDRN